MSFFLLALGMMAVPGLALQVGFGGGKLTSPLMIATWSWCYVVLAFLLASVLGLAPWSFWVILVGGVLGLGTAGFSRHGGAAIGKGLSTRIDTFLGAVVVVVGFSVYYAWVGPYMEIPADVYSHLGKLNNAEAELAGSSALEAIRLKDILGSSTEVWYKIYAYAAFYTGWSVHEVYPYAAYLNSVVFLLGTYYFALYVFRGLREKRSVKIWIAVLSAVFFLTYFGVNVFSYVRYYALAPTITGYLLFLASVVYCLEVLKGKLSLGRGATILGILTAAAAVLHLQESVFILAMIWTLSLVEVARSTKGYYRSDGTIRWWRSRSAVVCAAGTCAGALLWLASYWFLDRNEPSRPWILPLSAYLPFVRHLYILDPSFQGYHVLALWGYVVYALFLWNIRGLVSNTIVVAGMAVPLVTVFNPVFVDLFLRSQEPYTLYRMLYMVPLPLVGGYLLVKYCRSFWQSVKSRTPGLMACGPILLLVATLWPLDLFYIHNKFSRFYTLVETPVDNSPEYWGDLLARLRDIETSQIVTDSVTGYVINGITKHDVRTRKFKKVYIELDDQEYEDDRDMFADYDGSVLVINLRGGGGSQVGKLSGHWSENVLKTERYYSDGLIRFVNDNPEMFEKIWGNKGIVIYRIKFNA